MLWTILVGCGQLSDLETRTSDLEDAEHGHEGDPSYLTDSDIDTEDVYGRLDALEAAVDPEAVQDLVDRLDELEGRLETLEELGVEVDGDVVRLHDGAIELEGDEVRFVGVNVYIQNGMGLTDPGEDNDFPNGVGNLIVGYNEGNEDAEVYNRSGSHNLVIGRDHAYSAVGGLIAGQQNTVSANYSTVAGGIGNTANGYGSSVLGGASNSATANWSAVVAGLSNESTGGYGVVVGGEGNEASDSTTVVVGGSGNVLNSASSIRYGVVVGGYSNNVSQEGGVVVGGTSNTAGAGGVVVGGDTNAASATYSVVVGGGKGTSAVSYSVLLGGLEQETTGDNYDIAPDPGQGWVGGY